MKFCQVRPTEMLTNKYRFIKSQLKNYCFWQSDYADAWSWSRHLCKEHVPALLLLGSPAGCSLPTGPVSCFGVYNRSFLLKHRACKSLVKLCSAWLCSNNISFVWKLLQYSVSLGNRTLLIFPFDSAGRIWAVELWDTKSIPQTERERERERPCLQSRGAKPSSCCKSSARACSAFQRGVN